MNRPYEREYTVRWQSEDAIGPMDEHDLTLVSLTEALALFESLSTTRNVNYVNLYVGTLKILTSSFEGKMMT